MNPPISEARLEIHTIPHIKIRVLDSEKSYLLRNNFSDKNCVFIFVSISNHMFLSSYCYYFLLFLQCRSKDHQVHLNFLHRLKNTSSYHTHHQDYTDQVRSQLCLLLCKMHVSSPTSIGTDTSTYCDFPTVYSLSFPFSLLALACTAHTQTYLHAHTLYNYSYSSSRAFNILFESAYHITCPDVLQKRSNGHRFVELLVCSNV